MSCRDKSACSSFFYYLGNFGEVVSLALLALPLGTRLKNGRSIRTVVYYCRFVAHFMWENNLFETFSGRLRKTAFRPFMRAAHNAHFFPVLFRNADLASVFYFCHARDAAVVVALEELPSFFFFGKMLFVLLPSQFILVDLTSLFCLPTHSSIDWKSHAVLENKSVDAQFPGNTLILWYAHSHVGSTQICTKQPFFSRLTKKPLLPNWLRCARYVPKVRLQKRREIFRASAGLWVRH